MSDADDGLPDPTRAGSPVAAHTGDASFVPGMLDVDSVWVASLAAAGLATTDGAAAVAASARAGLYDLASLTARGQDGANAPIPLLGDMRALLAADGAPASASKARHRGATNLDIIDSALMLMASRALAVIGAELRSAANGLAALADAHRGKPCVVRSLTRHALPIAFGLRAPIWLSGVLLTGERLDAAKAALPLHWGGAGGTLAERCTWHRTGVRRPCRRPGVYSGFTAGPGRPRHALAHQLPADHRDRRRVGRRRCRLRERRGGRVDPLPSGDRGGFRAPRGRQGRLLGHATQAETGALRDAAQCGTGSSRPRFVALPGCGHIEGAPLRELLRLAGGSTAKLATLITGLGVHPTVMTANAGMSGVPMRELLRADVPTAALSDGELAALLDRSGYLGQSNEFIDSLSSDSKKWIAS